MNAEQTINDINNAENRAVKHHDTFVLVHGAWSSSYAWDFVKSGLIKHGHEVDALQLPGHGSDLTDIKDINMNNYIEHVIKVLSAIDEKVILVGHSMAGMIISAVAEQVPEKIKQLVYIAAYVPMNGQSAYTISADDTQSLLGASLIVSADQTRFDIKKDDIINIFCQDGADEIKKLILDHYKVEPGIPFSNPVTLTDGRFGSVEKHFIETLQDHGIGNDLQKRMIKAAKISHVYQINTGHSPFLSKPDEVVDILKAISNMGSQK